MQIHLSCKHVSALYLKNFYKKPTVLLVVIIVIAFLIYLPVMKLPLLQGWDDMEYMADPSIQELNWQHIKQYFSRFYLGMYQPLAVFSFAITHHFRGVNPLPHHAVNLALHLINIILVYFVARKLSGLQSVGLATALLFAIHPMNTEAVAWVAARSTGIFTLSGLIAIFFYLRYLDNTGRYLYFFVAFGFFTIALFSKSMAASLPLALLAIDYWKNRPVTIRMFAEKIPFLMLSVLFGIISIRAAASFGHITVLEAHYTLFDRIFLLSYGVMFYLVKLLLPVNLSAIYAYPAKTGHWLPAVYYGSAVAVAALIWLVASLKHKRRQVVAGLLFFLFSVGMVLPLFWSRLFIAADRYVYFAYFGLFTLAGCWLAGRLTDPERWPGLRWVLAITAIYVMFLCVSTRQRLSAWQSPRILMEAVIDINRSDADRAFAWFFLGNFSDSEGDYHKAEQQYSRAIDLYPGHVQALNNRGIMRGLLGDFEGSLGDFNQALRLKPDYAEAYYNRGILLYQVEQHEKACRDWFEAQKLGFRQASVAINTYCRQQR